MNKDLAETCLRYLDGELTEDELKAFNQRLAESAEAADLLAQLALDEQHYRSASADDEDVLTELLALEQAAEAECVEPLDPIHLVVKMQKTPLQIGGALRYLTNKPATWGALAAVLAIAVVLAMMFMGNPDASRIGEAGPSEPASVEPQTVATLTAEHNALWAERALARGSELRAGDRFTLTSGLAEITTARGAVVILEAPATIELIDSPNALRLHAGKLVGICETESSKGFLVRTPHMDITDVGTRFGIDASTSRGTHVQVFEGEVLVAHANDPRDAQPQSLVAGQAMNASRTALASAEYLKERFDAPLALVTLIDDLRPRFEGDPLIWQGLLPHDMGLHQQEADALQMFIEQRSLLLNADVAVDLLPGETWPPKRGFGKASVRSGSRADVYLLHLDPIGDQSGRHLRVQCVVRFDRPIVGLIGAQSTLRATDASLGVPGVFYPSIKEGEKAPVTGGAAGLDPKPYLDTATISDDGRTLTLDIAAAQSLDQLRVLVRSDRG